MNVLNRRQFLNGIAAAAGASAGMFGVSGAQAAERCGVPDHWDEEVDVVVVGTGFAGLAAAWEACKGGKSVALLEKMPVAGGNSAICGGEMTASGTPQQRMHHIEDSPELMLEDTLRAGSYMNDPGKVKFVADNQLDVYQWTVDEIGVKWAPNDIFQDGGHSVPRCVWSANGSGSGIVKSFLEKLEEKGIRPRVRTFVERLVRDPETGEMLGVRVREGYRFPKADSGRVKTIRARKAVVAAWGGFSADAAFRQIHDPRLTPALKNTNQPGATGELWREAARAGIAMVMVDAIQCIPVSNPNEKGFGVAWQFSENGAGRFGLWINSEGKRFVNELANRKVSADKMFEEQAKGRRIYSIGTPVCFEGLLSFQPNYLKDALAVGAIGEFATLEELCRTNGIPFETLKASVEQVNRSIQTGEDELMGRYVDKESKPLGEGPWYIAEMSPKVHHCMGGIRTNVHGQALDVATDQPVKGFYAAGECSGGTHGATRLGSNAILDCLAFGRVGGRQGSAL